MKQTILFTGKELKELWKTYKFLILCAVLLLFGMSSPLLAKLTPELFSQMLQEAAADVGRPVRLLETLMQSRDHPALLGSAPSHYLKGEILQIL